MQKALDAQGLSPLTRGNPPRSAVAPGRGGPIPAYAGQPWRCLSSFPCSWAYPRLRGATRRKCRRAEVLKGLSPLTRGNPTGMRYFGRRERPIPAYAGQPATSLPKRGGWWAYPRLRGATAKDNASSVFSSGLSPLTRGNRSPSQWRRLEQGPIPAYAGQPVGHVSSVSGRGAYPRLRGATAAVREELVEHVGLSPLTRGNHPKRPGAAV